MQKKISERLREESQDQHRDAEGSGFMRCFVKGAMDRSSYAHYLSALKVVYASLEKEIEAKKDHPAVKPIHFTELYRSESLEADLSLFGNPGTGDKSVAARAYADRIAEVASTAPYLLPAHAYVRYLGDLSGGQILKRIAQKSFELTDGQGLAFYEFPAVTDINAFKNSFRQALDNLPISPEEADALIKEGSTAFALNQKLFVELEPLLIAAIGQERFAGAQK
ncbi:MAG: biliverdin-producing heme oxygenase [Spirochaetia bacterium]|nr:biliverdin-producing heme oxygenase [Spirochaetia bacterium]